MYNQKTSNFFSHEQIAKEYLLDIVGTFSLSLMKISNIFIRQKKNYCQFSFDMFETAFDHLRYGTIRSSVFYTGFIIITLFIACATLLTVVFHP